MAVIYLDPSSPVSHRFLASPTPSFTFPNVSHHPVAHFLLPSSLPFLLSLFTSTSLSLSFFKLLLFPHFQSSLGTCVSFLFSSQSSSFDVLTHWPITSIRLNASFYLRRLMISFLKDGLVWTGSVVEPEMTFPEMLRLNNAII